MSFTNRGHKCEHFVHKSSGSEENYYTDEEGISEESLCDSITKLKSISIGKNNKNSRFKKKVAKNQSYRLNVTLRYRRKSNRHFRQKSESQKIIRRKKGKKLPVRVRYLEKPIETSKKGKRCHLGGKAIGKPPEEEDHSNVDKHDSDDESDNYYFGRISLGYFQKFRDKSGASTSYQWEEDHTNLFSLHSDEEKWDKISEDKELLELQRWGMTALVSSFNQESNKLKRINNHQPKTL